MNHPYEFLKKMSSLEMEKLKANFDRICSTPAFAQALAESVAASENESLDARRAALREFHNAELNVQRQCDLVIQTGTECDRQRARYHDSMTILEAARLSHAAATTAATKALRALAKLGDAECLSAIRRVGSLSAQVQNQIESTMISITRGSYIDCQYRHEVEDKRKRYREHLATLQLRRDQYTKIADDLHALRFAEISHKSLASRIRELLDAAGLPDADEEMAERTKRLISTPVIDPSLRAN